MGILTDEERFKLSERAIFRTKRLGAKDKIETIALLEKEIEEYRNKIFYLERHIKTLRKGSER